MLHVQPSTQLARTAVGKLYLQDHFERQALESPGLDKIKLGFYWDSKARLGDPQEYL